MHGSPEVTPGLEGVALLLAVIRVYKKHRRLGSNLDCPVVLAISLNLIVSVASEASGTGQLGPFLSPLWVSYKISTSVFVLSTCLVSLPVLNRTLCRLLPVRLKPSGGIASVLILQLLRGWVCTQGPMTACWGPSGAVCSLPFWLCLCLC